MDGSVGVGAAAGEAEIGGAPDALVLPGVTGEA
jgi:hypothetical protein